ncbi:hypothetical protein LCGC14_0431290 [marine sediment metagenome]|uniref:Uncharacterized protein n=1 Tax=marine sediment metagenome TaxID=412755 RepID=A0A0F9SU99_9ZZZZ
MTNKNRGQVSSPLGQDKLVEKIARIIWFLDQSCQSEHPTQRHKGAAEEVLQAILADPSIVKMSKEERGHILEVQQYLCDFAETLNDDGSCSICRSIKRKLAE